MKVLATQLVYFYTIFTLPEFSQSNQAFVGLDNPCLDKYRLCSVHCRVERLHGTFDCEFCVCDDPQFSIAWPDPTTTTTTTTTTPKPLPEGQWIANNIIYTRLKNPCYLVEASCPLMCKKWNETTIGNKTCERCHCDHLPGVTDVDTGTAMVFGRRNLHNAKRIAKRQLFCMPFACPIIACPPGQEFAKSPNGCKMCRCIEKQQMFHSTSTVSVTNSVETPSPSISPASIYSEYFVKLFCQEHHGRCPFACTNEVKFEANEYRCYHCHCPDNKYTALQNPCNPNNILCSENCTIRHLVDPLDHTMPCEYCDCPLQDDVMLKVVKRSASCGCSEDCVKIYGFASGVVGRRKRNGNCLQCFSCLNELKSRRPSTVQSPAMVTTIRPKAQVKPASSIVVTDDHCFTDDSLFPLFCSKVVIRIKNQICYYCRYYLKDNTVAYLSKTKVRLFEPHFHKTTYKSITSQPTTKSVPETTAPTTVWYTTHPTVTSSIATFPTTTAHMPTFKSTTQKQQTTSIPTFPTTTTHMPTYKSTTQKQQTTQITSTHTSKKHTTEINTTPSPTLIGTSLEPPPPQCHTCTNVTCDAGDLMECNTGAEYCMNTMTQLDDGSRTITRSCVSENECYSKWWIVSADNPECLSKTNTLIGRPGRALVCNFCCKGPGCNKMVRIPDDKLYTGDDHPSENNFGGIIQIG